VNHARAGELRIHYQDDGVGAPLVLLAGFTASGLLWPSSWVTALQEDRRLLRICNRGTGHSDIPNAPFTVIDMAHDVIAVLDDAGLSSANVLGWSMGGIVAQELATSAPDRVDRLILANSWPPGGEVRGDAITFGGESVWSELSGSAHRDAEELHELDRAFAAQPPSIEGVVHQLQALQEWTLADRSIAIRQPTLVIHGVDDPLIPVDNGRQLAKVIPHAQYAELEGVGHMFAWEAPRQTAWLINSFLAE
jgi:pimeloyl-ACP methyl ester carboxylesterase